MKLIFNQQRERPAALQNPFLRLGAAMLASLALACPGPASKKEEAPKPAPTAQTLPGDYTCTALANQVNSRGEFTIAGGKTGFTIHAEGQKLYLQDNVAIAWGMKGAPIIQDQNGFHFTGATSLGTTTIKATFSENGTLHYSLTRTLPGAHGTTFEYECTKCKEYLKAVFIRPAHGMFYERFGGNGVQPVAVKGRTLQSAVSDLARSGVTDIFIAFKTDYAWRADGQPGNLLFDSKYDNNEEKSFVNARQNGFDPIGALMNACQIAYAAAGKTVHFHAWFPVFKDEFAAKNFGGQSVYLDKGIIGNAWRVITGAKPDCVSDTFADPSNSKVVEYELATLAEITREYPALFGINLDYVRYTNPSRICNECGKTGAPLNTVNPAAVDDFVKQVKAKFPGLIISADVLIDPDMRASLAQAMMLQDLDMLLPMAYSYDPSATSQLLGTLLSELKQEYPTKTLVPILRGWSAGLPSPTPKGLISNLTSDLSAIKAINPAGYGIFTYELLLGNSGNNNLSNIKNKLGY